MLVVLFLVDRRCDRRRGFVIEAAPRGLSLWRSESANGVDAAVTMPWSLVTSMLLAGTGILNRLCLAFNGYSIFMLGQKSWSSQFGRQQFLILSWP